MDKMFQIKNKFMTVVNGLEQDHRTNTLLYKNKYTELSLQINQLFWQVKNCYHAILHRPEVKVDQEQFQVKHEGDELYEPSAILQFYKEFIQEIVTYCIQSRQKCLKNHQYVIKLLKIDEHSLSTLATKSLENFDLTQEVQALKKQLEIKSYEQKLSQKAIRQYQHKIKQFQNDYQTVVVSIAQLLKESEKNEAQLKQENRLQKELLQAHQIQFERFKADFKYRPSSQLKIKRATQVIENKYQLREIALFKQTQIMVQNKLRSTLKQNNWQAKTLTNSTFLKSGQK